MIACHQMLSRRAICVSRDRSLRGIVDPALASAGVEVEHCDGVPDDTRGAVLVVVDRATLPAATRIVQWEGVVVFKVGGKMFCLIAPRDHSVGRVCFKCPPEHYEALSRSPGFRPAPYLARAKWVALDDPRTLTAAETRAYIKRAHAVIAAEHFA